MPAATNRKDLISVTEMEYAKLAQLLEGVDEALAQRPFEEETSIKDTIGHRAHWIGLFFNWYAEGQTGAAAEIPAPGYKWNQLKEYNAKLRATQAGLSWDEVRALLAAGHAELVTFIEGKSDAELYGGPMPGGGNKWTTGRWVEAAGASHYRSAAKYVRACLRAATD